MGATDSARGQTLLVSALVILLAGASIVVAATTGSWNPSGRLERSSSATLHGLTVRLTVRGLTVPAGDPIPAVLTIENHTKRTISYDSCLDDTSLLVGISSPSIPFQPVSGTIGCSTKIHPGVNVFRESIGTTYQGCSGNGNGPYPPCGTPPIFTPLPTGSYQTEIVWQGVPARIPHPRPLQVTLTLSRQGLLRGFVIPCPDASFRPGVYIYRGSSLLEQLATFGGHYAESLDPGRYWVSSRPRMRAGASVVAIRPNRTSIAATLPGSCN